LEHGGLGGARPGQSGRPLLHLYGGPQEGSLTGTEAQLGQALTSWQRFWIAGRSRSHLPANEDFWITEFNINDEFGNGDKLPENKGTWGNGLGNVYCLNYWLAHEPHVKIALLHELARVIDGDGPGIHAHGRAWGLFARALTGRTRARALDMAGVPAVAGSGEATKGVVGWAFDAPGHSGTTAYALVNFTGTRQVITGLPQLPGATVARYVQASAPLAAATDPGETTGTIGRGRFLLPAYSVTVVSSRP